MKTLFIRGIAINSSDPGDCYPYSIPAVRHLENLEFTAPVTFLAGENGSGKSTIIEAVAVAAGFNAEGGTKNYSFVTEHTPSELANDVTLVRGPKREKFGYFLRAESFYTTANYAEKGTFPGGDQPQPILFNGRHIHEQSHGEAFMTIIKSFRPGLFLFDEPESALSPQRQLHLLTMMNELVKQDSQFIIATHSPILLAYPKAQIYQLSDTGITENAYDELEQVRLVKDFLHNTDMFLGKLFND